MRKLLALAFLVILSPALAADIENPQTNASALSTGTIPSGRFPAGQIPGTTTNNAATAGNFGEFLTATAASSAVSLSNSTAANCVTLPLTAGDWAVSGSTAFVGAASTTVLYARSSASAANLTENTVSNTFFGNSVAYFGAVNGAGFTLAAPAVRISLSGTTNVFLIGFMNFSVSTATCGGTINAWRVR